MNSKLKAVLFILVLLVPTYLAVAAYITSQSASVEDSRSVIKMTLSDPDGNIYTFHPEEGENASREDKEAAAQAKTEIEFLTSLNRNAKALDQMPDAADGARVFTVTYDSFNRTSVYKYYFTNDPASAFFEDPENKIYQIASADAAAFLCKDYAACLYKGSVYPVLTIGSATVTPKELDWRYQLFNGSYRPLETVTTPEMHSYRMNARLNFSFNLQPDVIDITIYDGEDIIYKDNYANLSQISITEQKQLHFQISAKWYEVDGKEGQGEAFYDFIATVNAPASFYLNQETVTNGDFCVITVKDKPEDAGISFTSEPSLGYTPVFVEDGNYHRALIPISCESSPGLYTFTLSCDGVTQELRLNVADKTYREIPFTISQSIINATRTEATLASFEQLMRPVAQSLSIAADHLFEGTFSQGVPDGSQIQTGFGHTRVINGGASYRHIGVDYIVNLNTDVSAINNGVVIFVGETDLTGGLVVIEHGLGLKSWYAHLNEALVEVGDTVQTGDVIAKSGATGFCEFGTAHISLTVFDVPVCPYTYWETPVLLNEP